MTEPYPFFCPTAVPEPAVVALRLEHRGRWDPEEEYWGEPGERVDSALEPIIAAGPREAWELEQVLPSHDGEDSEGPILAAVELAAGAERALARGLLETLLAEDERCLDAHAHLGSFAFDYSAALALAHFAAGVAIGERSLPSGFAGVLPWGWIDNRPFLRCLHGYGLCLWRLGDFARAEAVLSALLWLNPADNQGVRELREPVRAGAAWAPGGEPGSRRARGAGRRALLDRAAPALDRPPRTLAPGALAPLQWLLEAARDGLPLTQTGALGQRVVRDAAARFPDWWEAELFGPPHREAELPMLEELHALARRAGLLRRRGRRLLLTRRGQAALTDAEARADAAARGLIDGDLFEREVAELACAGLLSEPAGGRDTLIEAIHAAVAGDWRTDGGPVSPPAVQGAASPFLLAAIGVGALVGWRDLSLTDDGAGLLARVLRHSATASRRPRLRRT